MRGSVLHACVRVRVWVRVYVFGCGCKCACLCLESLITSCPLLTLNTPEQFSKHSVRALLFQHLYELFQNKFTAPSHKHAVVECQLRLVELCSLGLDWEIDGNKLHFDWSTLDEASRLEAAAAFFGKSPQPVATTRCTLPNLNC